MKNHRIFTVGLFTPDPWDHVCPIIRFVGPIEHSNWHLLRGNDWKNGNLQVNFDVIADSDFIIIQRDFPRFVDICDAIVDKARTLNKLIIYDIDDLLTELPKTHPDYQYYKSAQAPILAFVVQADIVTCPTKQLHEYLLQFNDNVTILPNYLNDQLWKLRQPSKNNNDEVPLVIGYMGSRSHINDLAMISPVLSKILDKFGEKVIFRSWGTPLPEDLNKHFNAEFIDIGLVSYREFADYFSQQTCNVFIAPLEQNNFNQCKSPLKFLEYTSLGVAGVYINISPYSTVINHGQNGYLAASNEEWYIAIESLLTSPPLRMELAGKAYDTLNYHWLLSKQIAYWQRTLVGLYETCSSKVTSKTIFLVKKFLELNQELNLNVSELEIKVREKEEIIKSLSIKLSEASTDLQDITVQLAKTNTDLSNIINSTSWRLLEFIYSIRLKLIPVGSFRESILKFVKKLTGKLYRFMRDAFRKNVPILNNELKLFNKSEINFYVESVVPEINPSVAILIEKARFLPYNVDSEAVIDWVNIQTLKPCEIIVWDHDSHIAIIKGINSESDCTHHVTSFPELSKLIQSDYICIASKDLIQQTSTYLEENLLALATHNLAFTLNVNGTSDWPIRHIKRGFLPGNRISPFLRAIVKKEYLRSIFSFDMSRWIKGQNKFPAIIGKTLFHTTSLVDQEIGIPMEINIQGADQYPETEFCIIENGKYILAYNKQTELNAPTEYKLYPPELVLRGIVDNDDRPTIFLLQPFLAIGGAEKLALHLIRQLNDMVRFIVLTVEPLAASLGTTADLYRKVTPYVYNFSDFLEPSIYLSYMFHLIERFKPKAYYIHNGSLWLYETLSEIKRRYPEIRVISQVYDSQFGWINRYTKDLIKYIDAHIGTNSAICNAYMSRGVPADDIYLIPHGIDPNELRPENYTKDRITAIKAAFGISPQQRVVTFASRLNPQKRPLDFVELARRFSHDLSVKFLMVGDGPLAPIINEQIERTHINNLTRSSFYQPISDILAITDVLVLPSEYEGMPLILLESQAMGKPVVVTDVGNNKDILQITSGGIVTEIGDIEGLMRGVQKMLSYPPEPSQTRTAVVRNFSIEVVAPQYLRALLGLNSNDEFLKTEQVGIHRW
jgi:glycosyltransferase involved in cell wall biosynthesis